MVRDILYLCRLDLKYYLFLILVILNCKNMRVEVNPMDTIRGEAFDLWMSSPMPMVTLTKTFDVSKVLKKSKKLGVGFNVTLCWCIAKAASQMELFYLLPERGKLFKYDSLAINVIVKNKKGGINSCDIPFDGDMKKFIEEYKVLTSGVSEECKSLFGKFDVVTARAVSALPILLEICSPLIKVGGVMLAYKTDESELEVSKTALEKLNMTHKTSFSFNLPTGDRRSILVFEKTAPTPNQYPRQYGQIKKRPL